MTPGVHRTPALAFRESRLRLVRLAQLLAAAGGITVLVAGGSLIDGFGPGALVAVVVGLAALAGGVALARHLARTVRYRVDKPNSLAVLTGKVTTLLVVLAGAVVVLSAIDAPSLPRSVIVVVLVGVLAAVANHHSAHWTLLHVDATGIRLGKATMPWSAVTRLDVAATYGTATVGAHLAPEQQAHGTPGTTVPAAILDVERLRWAVGQFGNPAIPVLVHQGTAAPMAPMSQAPAPAGQPSPSPAPQGCPPPGQPQRGWPQPSVGHGWPEQPGKPRTNAVAAAVAGLLALVTAGLQIWFAVANIEAFDTPWPSVVTVNVYGGFASAGVLLLAATITFTRSATGAWILAGLCLFFVIMIVISPLLRGESLSAHMTFVFGFHKATGVATGLTTITGLLNAVAAAVAGASRRP